MRTGHTKSSPDVGKINVGAAAILSEGHSSAHLAEICSIDRILDIVWDFRIEYESLSFFFLPPARYVIIIIG